MLLSTNATDDNQKVLICTGKGAICSNSHTTINDILNLNFDHTRILLNCNKDFGGDGSTHSIRNRNTMPDALRNEKREDKGHDGQEHYDVFFLGTLMEMNKNEQGKKYCIPTK